MVRRRRLRQLLGRALRGGVRRARELLLARAAPRELRAQRRQLGVGSFRGLVLEGGKKSSTSARPEAG